MVTYTCDECGRKLELWQCDARTHRVATVGKTKVVLLVTQADVCDKPRDICQECVQGLLVTPWWE